MTEWNKVKLGEICSITSSKRIFAKEYQTEGIPFYRGKEIIEKHNGNDVSTELFITRERYEEIKNKFDVPHRGDILLSSVGTLGVSWLVDEEEFYFKDGNLTWLRCNGQTTPEFLYLWLNSPEAQNQIDAMCIGSTQKALTIETLNKFNVTLPTLDIQKKICEIIIPISKKITVNRAINRNLSEQLKVLFAELFPNISSNGDSKLEDLIQFTNGKKRPDSKGDIPVYGGNGVLSYTDKSNAENCVIIGRVGAYCGSLYLSIGQCWISDNAIMAKDKNRNSQLFIYYLLQILGLSNRHIGTSQPLLTQGILNTITIKIPEEELITKFGDVADAIQKQIDKNTLENNRLTELRDSLLPKLISGDLDISDLDI